MDKILFFIVVLVANIIQGITSFAGTVIAMPFSIMLIDIEYSKFILNILGILASLYILKKNYKVLNVKELKKILIYMVLGLIIGMQLYKVIDLSIILKILPLFIILVALKGLFFKKEIHSLSKGFEVIILLGAGIIHGMFVIGGPILIIYATTKFKDKYQFRVTLAAVWIVLNSLIFINQAGSMTYSSDLIYLLCLAIIALYFGMIIGEKLVHKMPQALFMQLSYLLILISGITILIR